MNQLWNPREVLNVQNHSYSCVGKGKKKPCGNTFFSNADRAEARAILDSMAVQPPASSFVLCQLRRLAYVSLCPLWHRDKPGHAQVDRMQSIWTEAIRRYTAEAARITAAQPQIRTFIHSPAVLPSPLAPVQSFQAEIEPDFDESPLPSPLATPAALEEEESDFEDSGIDLSADVQDSAEASDEFSEQDQEDSEQEGEASMANHPYLALNFASAHPVSFQPWLHTNVSSLVDVDIESATQTETSASESSLSTGPATPTIAAVESISASLDAGSSEHAPAPAPVSVIETTPPTTVAVESLDANFDDISPVSEKNRLSVALSHLSDTWQSFQMTAKDYSTRYNLFNFRSVSWKEIQHFVGDGTNLGIAGFVGMGCVLWWTLRGRPRVETVASMLWTRRR